MKILVIKSSANRGGSSAMIADEFVRGAEEKGHEVTVFSHFDSTIRPCRGCGSCGMAGPCVLNDDFENVLKPLIRDTDLIAFAMPVYYYSWPAPLKKIVDRFYSFTIELTSMKKDAVLLAVAWDDTDTVFDLSVAFYKKLCEYLQFRDRGMILGRGCGTSEMTRASVYPEQAYELGKSL